MQKPCNYLPLSLFIVLLTTFSYSQIQSQQKPKPILPLSPLMTVLRTEFLFLNFNWELGIAYSENSNRPKLNEEVLEDFEEWLQRKPRKEVIERITEYNLALKYKENIKEIFSDLSLIGNKTGMFLYDDTVEIPIRFAQKENKIVFIVTRVGSDNVFNTLRTTSKTRAAEIISSMILPEMRSFYDSFKGTDIKYYGMIIAYGSKNFLEESKVLDLKPEIVALIVSAENCKKFTEGLITEDEMIELSDIYLKDRDMLTGIKKTKITLE